MHYKKRGCYPRTNTSLKLVSVSPVPIEIVAFPRQGVEIYHNHFLDVISPKFVGYPLGIFSEIC